MARWAQRRRDTAMLQARRLEGVAFVRGGLAQATVARRLGVSPAAVSRWVRTMRESGEAGLGSVRRPGRPSRVDRAAQARLPGILALGAARSGFPSDRWTLARIAKAAEDSWGVRYSRGTIHRILVTQGFRWTRPERRPGRPSKVRPQGKAEPGSAQAWSPGPRVLRLMRSRVRVGRAKGRRRGPNRRIRA